MATGTFYQCDRCKEFVHSNYTPKDWYVFGDLGRGTGDFSRKRFSDIIFCESCFNTCCKEIGILIGKED